jgi:Predicted phosphoesterases, related to the Icc protein
MFKFNKEKLTRIYYASDIHGSQKCFNKFINAGKFYEADVIIMGGDITGKSILHIEKQNNGNYRSNFMGIENAFSTNEEMESFKKSVQTAGFYPYISTSEEWEAIKSDPAAMDTLFAALMKKSLEEWMDFAEQKLKDTNIKCFVMPGNDDPLAVSEILKESTRIIDPDGKIVQIDDHLTMVSCGYSNPTPWNSPRECSEVELKAMIDKMMQSVPDPHACILNAHVPPFNSTLDDAPKLSSSLQVQSSGGVVETAPVGSTAVMEAIKQYGYILSLHGHIHEVHAIKEIGRTLSINPGSDYGDGVLHGALVSLSKDKVKSYQLVSG